MDDFFVHDVVDALFAFDHVVKHSDPRPSVDNAKDWLDQSFRFPIWALLRSGLIWSSLVWSGRWR